MKIATLSGLALLVATVMGCGQGHYAQWKNLDVVYASQVPIYPGALVEDTMGGNAYGEGLDDHVSETITYWFKIDPNDRDRILAFYEKELPHAERTLGEDGEVRFEIAPQGGEAGETVWVVVGKDQLKIGEETKPGKHKEAS